MFLNVVLDEGEEPHSVAGRFTAGENNPYSLQTWLGRSFYSF